MIYGSRRQHLQLSADASSAAPWMFPVHVAV